MNVAYTNKPGELLFTKNAADLVLEFESGESYADVSLVRGSEESSLVRLVPDADGKAVLLTREIAQGLPTTQIGLGERFLAKPTVQYKIGGVFYDIPWIKGGFDPTFDSVGSALANGNAILSFRPLTIKTYPRGREYLSFIYKGTMPEILLTMYDTAGGSYEEEIHLTAEGSGIVCIDASPEAVDQYWIPDRGEMAAYEFDFIFNDDHQTFRFELSDGFDWTGFLFRNSLGVFDTLYAKGKTVNKIQRESSVFRNHFQEKESSSSSARQKETFTGWIEGETMRNLWLEFIESDEHYIFTGDRAPEPIILDEVNGDLPQDELSGFSFTWHLARLRQGSTPAKSDGFTYVFDSQFH